MKKLDSRLDFANSIKEYLQTLTTDDTLFVLSHNSKMGDLIINAHGSPVALIKAIKEYQINELPPDIQELFNDFTFGEEKKEAEKNDMFEFFRLEFNEEQQCFHHSYPHQNREPNTNGWFTVSAKCTDIEFKYFESFINRFGSQKFTKQLLIELKSEFEGFKHNLSEYGLHLF